MNSSKTSPKDLAATINDAAPRHNKRRRILIVGAAVLVALSAGVLWSKSKNGHQGPPPFVTTPLQRGDISLTITSTGNLEPTNEVTIGSELSGTVLEVFVDANDHVTKGQPMARLDTNKLTQQTISSRASLKSAEAKLAQAQATANEADATLARQKDLYSLSGGRSPSRTDMDSAVATAERAHADLLSAKAAVDQAEAQVKINETDLSKGIIRSPIDGVVLTRSVEPGQTVAASFTAPELFVLAEDLKQMKLKVKVAEADIGRLTAGQNAVFTVDAWPSRAYTAKVTRVSYGSSVTNNVVTYETELEVANDDLSLRPGMTATADINVAQSKGVLKVPAAALRFDPSSAMGAAGAPGAGQNKTFLQSLMPMPPRMGSGKPANSDDAPSGAVRTAKIWVLENGNPEPVTVKTGLSDGRFTEISGDDLQEGEAVITRALTPSS